MKTPNIHTTHAVRTQLTWTHLRSLMGVEDPLARQFYAEMCAVEHWDTSASFAYISS
ncbi:MAG: DUF1016 N-terminal domain-containing protein [Prevotella sp.]|uniref:DUF1016 N-terminal domain-containing protein n=1 Tax=Prevotella sp. TaxID=59823 RepID=UPI0025896FC5|nr:DUF1016 N-terminal domain-containing protein [Prevotella sp.]MDD6854103.1 DUF1016 N-terminal domain-containing protein [Prevotella sp.]